MLVVEARIVRDEQRECCVGVVAQQVFAERFRAMQGGGFTSVLAAIVGQRGTGGCEVFLVVRAHQFGEMRELALVRDVRRCALHFGKFVADVAGQLQLVEPRRWQLRQLPGESQHVERFAAACSATGAFVVGVFFDGVHGRGFERESKLNTNIVTAEASSAELDRLADLSEDVIRRARAAGASQAEVSASVSSGLSVNVRMGEVETVERNRDRGFGLTVYFGQRKGSASTADLKPGSIEATLGQACAIARFTEPDPCAGLADAALMQTSFPELDLWHPWQLDVDRAIEIGREVEAAGRDHPAVTNSEGASVQCGDALGVYANSHGFVGRERGTHHSISCSLIVGKGDAMQRDGWYEYVRDAGDFPSFDSIGRKAGGRAAARLDARRLSTRECPVMFAPEVARSLVGHLVAAVSGGSLYRRASFLLDHVGKQVLPTFVGAVEQPWLPRGHASSAFDAEGVATRESALVQDGVLQRYVLGSYSARKLGLTTTGNAGGVHNLAVAAGSVDGEAADFRGMLRRMGTGLLVTELIGQGVSIITGDYSRGAAGFWIENGEVAYPVQEITIAGNLRDMFMNVQAIGTDVDPRSSILVGSILVGKMTLAGE